MLPVIVGTLLSITLILSACGSSNNGASADTSATGTEAEGASSDTVAADVNDAIGTMLEVVTGSRGEKEDAPGKIRFMNLLAKDGAGVDIDVYWGLPDEGEKAVTLASGATSEYLSLRKVKGFEDAPYSVTRSGTKEILWQWDRLTPAEGLQRLAIFSFNDGSFSEQPIEESSSAKNFDGKPQFEQPTAGNVAIRWIVSGDALDDGENLLAAATGGKCFTNGSGLAGPDGNQIDASTAQVPAGAEVALYAFGDCGGVAKSNSVKLPAGGRALLIAFLDPTGKHTLTVLPVEG